MANLSITPSQLEIQLKPGSNYVQSYIIKNNSDQTITLNSSIDTWIPQGPNGDVNYLNSSPDINLSLSNTDLKLGQNFLLNPHQSTQLVLKIQIPESIIQGDRYLTFFINQSTSTNLSSNSTQLIKLGSHLLISVTDSEQSQVKFNIDNFKTNHIILDCFLSTIKFNGEIVNLTNYFAKIDDSIIITKNNNEITRLTVFPDNILSHHSRSLRCIENNLPTECQLTMPVWPGLYQASIGKQKINFIVFPYAILCLLFIITTVIIIDRYFHRKL